MQEAVLFEKKRMKRHSRASEDGASSIGFFYDLCTKSRSNTCLQSVAKGQLTLVPHSGQNFAPFVSAPQFEQKPAFWAFSRAAPQFGQNFAPWVS